MHKATAPMDYANMEPDDAQDLIAAAAISTLNLVKLAKIKPTPKRFVIPKLAPAGEVTLFTGPGSSGKSLLAQQLTTALAAGKSTLRFDMTKSKAIYITCEDDAEQLHWRQAHICRSLNVAMESLAGSLHLASLRGNLDNALALATAPGEFQLTPAYERVAALIRRTGAAFVALDNVAHLFAGNENDRGDVTRFINTLNRLAGETGAAILLLGHPNKSGDSYSGSTAWLNAVRSQICIEHDLTTDMRTLTVGKANYVRKGDAIRFAWVDWAFAHEDDLLPDTARALAETVRASGENSSFLRCLTVCTEQRRNVSHQPGVNYAPQIFAGMTEAKGVKVEGFKAAMERLLHIGKIELDVCLWPGTNRHKKRGIRITDGQQ